MRCNDNAFLFNRILGYNTEFYDIRAKYWYWDETNPRAATYYIKFGTDRLEYVQPFRPNNDDMTVIKDDEIIIPGGKFIPSAQVLEVIGKYIIPLNIHIMLNTSSIVSIHPSTNIIKPDEFQIKIEKRSKLPLLQIGNSETQNRIDFSEFINNGEGYSQNFRT